MKGIMTLDDDDVMIEDTPPTSLGNPPPSSNPPPPSHPPPRTPCPPLDSPPQTDDAKKREKNQEQMATAKNSSLPKMCELGRGDNKKEIVVAE